MGNSLPRFVVVGALGFAVDAGLLALLVGADWGLYVARLVSFPAAVTVTWYLNRIWTFRDGATASPAREYAAYAALQVAASLANFLVYAALLRFVFGEQARFAVPALALGAVVGLVVNYLGARAVVFVGDRQVRTQQQQNQVSL